MQKQEPRIFAGGISNDELFIWMKEKVNAAALLKSALIERDHLKLTLLDIETKIAELTSAAALEVLDTNLDPTLLLESLGKTACEGMDNKDPVLPYQDW